MQHTSRFTLTEDEHIQIVSVCNQFYDRLGRIVAAAMVQVPDELHALLLDMLEERASVHGSDYEKHLRLERHKLEAGATKRA